MELAVRTIATTRLPRANNTWNWECGNWR